MRAPENHKLGPLCPTPNQKMDGSEEGSVMKEISDDIESNDAENFDSQVFFPAHLFLEV